MADRLKQFQLLQMVTHALTASFDYSIIFWRLVGDQGEIVHRMFGHDAAVNDVVFTPDQTTSGVS